MSVLLGFFWSLPVYAAPTVILNGRQAVLDVPVVVQEGTVLVPLRAIAEPLGAEIAWNQQTQAVIIRKDITEINLYIGKPDAFVNGARVDLSVPVQVINGRTMVPLQFIGDALNAEVSWDPDTQTIVFNAAVSASRSLKSAARVHFIDAGQGDAIYIQLSGHNDILIDGGNLDAEGTILQYLKQQNLDDLELVVATNSDAHHVGALPAVMSGYEVEKLVYSGNLSDNASDDLLKTAQTKNIPVEADHNQSFVWEDISLQILTGPADGGGEKDHSIVSRLTVGNIKFLFMSDADEESENALPGDIKAQILKIGNHGSIESTSQKFLNRVNPEIAVISLNGDRWYGHDSSTLPAPQVLDRLQKQGAKVFRTDLEGTVVVTTDGLSYDVN